MSRWLCPSGLRKSSGTQDSKNLLPEELPGINLKDGLERIGGNRASYLRILQRFPEEATALLEEVTPGSIHQLKGYAGNLGAYEVMALCASIEEALAAETQTDGLVRQMKQAVRTVEESVHQ